MTKFMSRAELGLARPASRSTNIDPSRGGLAVHWGGPAQRIGNHDRCIAIWNIWQRFHMGRNHPTNPNPYGRHWADIAYNFGFCNHNYVLAGRGLRVRSAANGTNQGNLTHYAAVWIGGENERIANGAYSALEAIVELVRSDGAGLSVVPHSRFTGTSCPGMTLSNHTRTLHNQPLGGDDMTPEQDRMLRAIYRELCEGGDDNTPGIGSRTIRDRTWQSNAALGRMEREHGPGMQNLK